MMADYQQILEGLLRHKATYGHEVLTPAKCPEALQLIHNNSFAFISACCLDRGTKAEIIWTIPYWLSQQVGHYDPKQFYPMSLERISFLYDRLPQKPLYTKAAPRTFQEICRIVVEDFSGKAENIWKNRCAMDVKRTLLSVYGVGNGIANMTLILIESVYDITFSDIDYTKMDIKPDVHTMRVLYRLGASPSINTDSAILAARHISPSYPGAIDGPLWSVGRNWGHPASADCGSCPLDTCCEKVGVK
jgi:endonuclease III